MLDKVREPLVGQPHFLCSGFLPGTPVFIATAVAACISCLPKIQQLVALVNKKMGHSLTARLKKTAK